MAPELLLTLDLSRPRRLREQVEQELRRAIADERLTAGDVLPASRALAAELGVSRSVVVQAYETLAAAGYLEAQQGSGTRVRARAVDDRPALEPVSLEPESWRAADYVSGLPDAAQFPRAAWQRHYRDALMALPDATLAYPQAQGALPLRRALSRHLGRSRSVSAVPGRILICNGFAQGLTILAGMLARRGATAVAVEEPCFEHHRRIIRNAGLSVVPIRTDEHGLDPGELAAKDVAAVVVAPAHCFPFGSTLSAARRVELLRWATDVDALVIEDDYDAEFRYDRRPIGAVQGLAPDRVVYGGSVSKVLSPALRLGWLVLPERLVRSAVREKFFDDIATGTLEQAALASFVESGALTRHLRRVASIYRRRRIAALDAVERGLPGARVHGTPAGLHLFVELPPPVDEHELIDGAAELGVRLEGARPHYANPERAPNALVLGYGATTEQAIQRGLQVVSPLYRSLLAGGC